MKFPHCADTSFLNREKQKNLTLQAPNSPWYYWKWWEVHYKIENSSQKSQKVHFFKNFLTLLTFNSRTIDARAEFTHVVLRQICFLNFLAGKPILNFSWWNSKQKSETKDCGRQIFRRFSRKIIQNGRKRVIFQRGRDVFSGKRYACRNSEPDVDWNSRKYLLKILVKRFHGISLHFHEISLYFLIDWSRRPN